MDGGGIEGIAPPFQGSEYLSGPAERVALIVLHGLKGPVHVDGKRYETNQAMPGLMGNSSLTNDDISDVIMYVTNAFSRSSKYISPEKINKLRKEKPEGGGEYTEQDLMEYVKALN
ncbi:MAG: cytochrome c, partial [Leeuwenhoekiella sp.]